MAPTRGYTSGSDTLPLFGEDSKQKQYLELAFGGLTALTVLLICLLMACLTAKVTIGIAFDSAGRKHPDAVDPTDVFFALVIIMISLPQLILVKWFHNGDLHPKFRYLIGFMMLAIMLLCSCGIAYMYYGVGEQPGCRTGTTTTMPFTKPTPIASSIMGVTTVEPVRQTS